MGLADGSEGLFGISCRVEAEEMCFLVDSFFLMVSLVIFSVLFFGFTRVMRVSGFPSLSLFI